MVRVKAHKAGRAALLGKAMHLWAEGWVTFVRSAGGRVEDTVGANPWLAARTSGEVDSHG
jgi:hypothetical protein